VTTGTTRILPTGFALGNDWAAWSGDQYSYMMAFDSNAIEGAWALDAFVDVIRRM
jgi:hypothetical protein